jgi:hypothetical protein
MPDKPEHESPTNAEFSAWLKDIEADHREATKGGETVAADRPVSSSTDKRRPKSVVRVRAA